MKLDLDPNSPYHPITLALALAALWMAGQIAIGLADGCRNLYRFLAP